MTLDSEQQKELLLQMFEQVTIQGKFLSEAHALREAIRNATVQKEVKENVTSLRTG